MCRFVARFCRRWRRHPPSPADQHLTGDARPKQFCRLSGGRTLLDQTRERADLVIGRDRQLIVVTATHAPAAGFSELVLARLAHRFSVMRVKDVGWSDLGNPRRVAEAARRRGHALALRAAAASMIA